MTLMEHIARCEREIQQCRKAAATAGNDLDRYGLTWAEVDWLVAKQLYEDELAAVSHESSSTENPEDQDGLSNGR
jgi:hypothetical protein